MDLRLRNIFKPAAHGLALFFDKLGFSRRALNIFLYLLILTTILNFILLIASPFNQELLILSVVLVFLCGFFDEVKRDYLFLVKDKETLVDRYADLPVIGAILYYLNSSYFLASIQYLALGGVILLGMLLLNYALKITVKGGRSPGFEVPAERLFLLSVFAVAGYNHRSLEEFLFAGLIGVAFFLYATVLHSFILYKEFSVSFAKARSISSGLFGFYLGALKKIKIGAGLLYEAVKRATVKPQVPVETPGIEKQEGLYPSEPAAGYNYTILVVDAKDEQPISNARVTMTSVETSKSESRRTDSAGKCRFPDMMEGQYLITVKAEGYKEEQYDRYISIDSGEVFRMHTPLVDLSVVVNDLEKRAPIPNAVVTLAIAEGEDLEGLTDNLGVAYFDQLPPSFAELSIKARGYEEKTGRINLDAEKVVSFNLKRKAFMKFEGPSLVEYDQVEGLEEVIKEVIGAFAEKGRDVYLVSTPPLLDACSGEGVKAIDFSSAMPEDIEPLLEEMPAGGVLIFEAVTDLIHRIGLDEALKFMGKLVEYTTREELNIVALINRGAHGERIAAMFEKIFQGIAEVKDGRLVERSEGS